jgi:hypothetical protein
LFKGATAQVTRCPEWADSQDAPRAIEMKKTSQEIENPGKIDEQVHTVFTRPNTKVLINTQYHEDGKFKGLLELAVNNIDNPRNLYIVTYLKNNSSRQPAFKIPPGAMCVYNFWQASDIDRIVYFNI